MKKLNRLLVLFLAMAIVLSPAASMASQASGSGDRVPITWLTTGDAAAKPIGENDRIVEAINERLGIDLTIEYVPEANVEKVNVAMASGDFPDIVTGAFGTSATQQWIDDGIIIPMNQFMDANPSLSERLNEHAWSAQNGNYYGAPFISMYSVAHVLILMRQDWLDNLGLSYPKTLEEMKATMLAFTNDDPDGNGVKDTFAYTTDKPSSRAGTTSFDWVFFAYGWEYGDYALDANGNVIPWFEGDWFIPGMTYIKELWDSGVIDNEFMLNEMAKKEEKFYQGLAGMVTVPLFRNLSRHEKSLRQIFPDATVAFDLPPAGPEGKFGMSRQAKNGFMTAITAACKNPDKAAAFIDFMLSKEGNDLVRLGIEGIHYTMDGDKVVINEEERAKDAFSPNGWAHALAWGSLYWPVDSNYMPDAEPNRERAIESVELGTKAMVPNLIKQKTPLEVQDGAMLNDIIIQYFSDMMQGKIGIEEGAAELSSAWRAQGGDELLAELNEAYKAQIK